MISPTVGRVVWYRPLGQGPGPSPNDQPLAAIVTHVWTNTMVNLVVFDTNGYPHGRTSVTLLQDGDAAPEWPYAEWMPYQKGQAAKTEAAEKLAAQPQP